MLGVHSGQRSTFAITAHTCPGGAEMSTVTLNAFMPPADVVLHFHAVSAPLAGGGPPAYLVPASRQTTPGAFSYPRWHMANKARNFDDLPCF